MAMRRAASYSATITPPKAPGEYSAILVTFAQDQRIVLSKSLEDLTIDGGDVVVELTQEETLQFAPSVPSPMGTKPGGPAYLQIRCYAGEYDAPASAAWAIEVYDVLDPTILPGEGAP